MRPDYPDFTGDEPCREIDPDLIYPVSFMNMKVRDRVVLEGMCNACPMREPCLMWAIRHEDEGWWAGTMPTDRMKLRKKMGIRLERVLTPIGDRRAS